jgi:hypothetical protein
MRGAFLIVYVGQEGEKLNDYGSRPMKIAELPVDLDNDGMPFRDDLEAVMLDLVEPTERKYDSRPCVFAVIPLADARTIVAVPRTRAEIISWGGIV